MHFNNKSLRGCEFLNGSRLESTQVQEIRHGLRVSRTRTTIPGDSDLTFRTAIGELVKGGKANTCCGLRRLGIQSQSSRCFKRRFVNHSLSVGEYTTTGGATVLYGDKCYMFHKGSNVAKKIDAWIQDGVERFSITRLNSCVQRKQRVQHLHETERKQD